MDDRGCTVVNLGAQTRPAGLFGVYRYGYVCTNISKVGVESEFALVGVRTWCHSVDVATHGFFVGL